MRNMRYSGIELAKLWTTSPAAFTSTEADDRWPMNPLPNA